MTANLCGGCTACCTLMAVDFPTYRKPPRETCTHCVKGGCGIYADRPNPCVGFQCGWLVSQQMEPRDAMPSAARPDRSGVVIEVNSHGNAVLHAKTPNAWRAPVMHKIVMRLAAKTTVLVEGRGDDVTAMSLIDRYGEQHPLKHVGVAPNGENKYMRADAA